MKTTAQDERVVATDASVLVELGVDVFVKESGSNGMVMATSHHAPAWCMAIMLSLAPVAGRGKFFDGKTDEETRAAVRLAAKRPVWQRAVQACTLIEGVGRSERIAALVRSLMNGLMAGT